MAASTQTYPKKLFYRINEVAEIVGVEAYVLRYWETKFPMLKPERYGNDERRYRSKDIDLLLRIRRLLYDEKYTIAGAVERLRKDPKGNMDQKAEVRTNNTVQLPEDGMDADEQLQLFAEQSNEAIKEVLGQLTDIRSELESLRQEYFAEA